MIKNLDNKSGKTSNILVASAIYRLWSNPSDKVIAALHRLPADVTVVNRRPKKVYSKKPRKVAFVLVSAQRHYICLEAFKVAGLSTDDIKDSYGCKTTQGFVDEYGNFYDRYESLKLVVDNPLDNFVTDDTLAVLEDRLKDGGVNAILDSYDLW